MWPKHTLRRHVMNASPDHGKTAAKAAAKAAAEKSSPTLSIFRVPVRRHYGKGGKAQAPVCLPFGFVTISRKEIADERRKHLHTYTETGPRTGRPAPALSRRERRISTRAQRVARRGDRVAPPDRASRRAAPRVAAGRQGARGLPLRRRSRRAHPVADV